MLVARGCKHVSFRQRVLKLKKSRVLRAIPHPCTHAISSSSSIGMALAAMAGAKPSFKGSLEKGPTSPLGLNGKVCADDGSAALDGCKRAARTVQKALVRESVERHLSHHPSPPFPSSHHSLCLFIPHTANPPVDGECNEWEDRLMVRGAATHPLAGHCYSTPRTPGMTKAEALVQVAVGPLILLPTVAKAEVRVRAKVKVSGSVTRTRT